MIVLDELDRSIVELLIQQQNLTPSEISRSLKVSQSKVWRRIKSLKDSGVLNGKQVLIDIEKLGFGVTVFLGVKLATKGRVSLIDFEKAVTSIP